MLIPLEPECLHQEGLRHDSLCHRPDQQDRNGSRHRDLSGDRSTAPWCTLAAGSFSMAAEKPCWKVTGVKTSSSSPFRRCQMLKHGMHLRPIRRSCHCERKTPLRMSSSCKGWMQITGQPVFLPIEQIRLLRASAGPDGKRAAVSRSCSLNSHAMPIRRSGLGLYFGQIFAFAQFRAPSPPHGIEPLARL
ncbi:Uncharacterised protein [Pannonibacter phragmitetus]|uniref:Uncharacterized protein n=1 Tax=Pannonibacter phragmitetus TaxID=121719 RepID=A0A378ZXD0_9HYPH|nr:Uncharacterised protein [Pannonibacter phragmitetus]